MAVAGGANLILHPAHLVGLASRSMLSPDGRCRVFDAGANGFVPGEGVGAVLLKSLADAEADNDEIWGVIKGSFVNSAGHRSGFTVPNPTAQADLITEAIRRAGMTPQSIGYIEAHGTGTKLGDPLETAALNAALTPRADGTENGTAGRSRCAIGSVKANIGHLEGAAGIAGLTKLLLQLRHRQIAPCVHLDKVNPMIDTESGRFYFPTELTEWISEPGTPRRGGVSAFGGGGAGVHVIVEQYPDERRRSGATTDADGEEDVFLLSARTRPQLRIIAEQAAELLARPDAPGLRALTYMAALRRKEMPVRLAVLARSTEEVLAGLRSYLHGDDVPRVCHGTAVPHHDDGGNSKPVVAETREYGELAHLARLWIQGSVVDWRPLWPGPRPFPVTLPRYPFAKKRYWIPLAHDPGPAPSPSVTVASGAAPSDRAPTEEPAPSRLAIERELRSLATRFLRVPEEEIDVDMDLVTLGFDSISLIQLVGDLQDTYEIDLDEAVDAVLSGHLSLAALADHVEGATAAGHVPATMPELGER
jgi:acyl transferase domain-containing protein